MDHSSNSGLQGSKAACNVSVVGQNSSVTVNSGSGRRQVLITPLSSVQQPPSSLITHRQILATPLSLVQRPVGTPQSKGQSPVVGNLDKIILKVVCKGKKDSRSFTLRNITAAELCSCDSLKEVIRRQLQDDITAKDFDVGYVQGSNVIRIRSREDLSEVWADLRRPNSKLVLWCDGLKERRNRKRTQNEADSDDDDISVSTAKKRKQQPGKEEEVKEILESLKKKHDSNYTPMQFRIWAEMVAGGLHTSTDDHPNTTMFARAGGGTPYRKKSQQSPVAELLTEAATAISSALSPKPTSSPTSGLGTSPAKLIESRSKLYKQLSELQNLRSMGVLTEAEYCSEKESIMELLKKLKTTPST